MLNDKQVYFELSTGERLTPGMVLIHDTEACVKGPTCWYCEEAKVGTIIHCNENVLGIQFPEARWPLWMVSNLESNYKILNSTSLDRGPDA